MTMERISNLETEIELMRKSLNAKENELYELKKSTPFHQNMDVTVNHKSDHSTTRLHGLPKWAIERYSRQILVESVSACGQERLLRGRVLVVGAGGLGCPAAMYLAGAGVGEIGIVDYDTVDLTNIHRQILHSEADQDRDKVESAANTLKSINSKVNVTTYKLHLNSANAMEIVQHYDVILDCTDNVPTRYLLNDACVLAKLPLISGSALKLDGQLTTYGYRAERNSNEKLSRYVGPCYRCVFPSPPPPAAVGSCSEAGVLGPVPGVLGTLQALEAIKYLIGNTKDKLMVERMLLFDGDDMTFKTVRLRPRNQDCAICSEKPTVTTLIDYELFCKTQSIEKDSDLKILSSKNRVTPKELSIVLSLKEKRHLLVDVRNHQEFQMCHIDGAVRYPIDEFGDENVKKLADVVREGCDVTFVCRRGNDSQIAAKKLLDHLGDEFQDNVKDVVGGLHAWAKDVDREFPVY